jgi:uncharacterized membrane protein YdjX (TVP38/TMEM64 family)
MTVPTSSEVTGEAILPTLTPSGPSSWIGRHWQKVVALLLWVGLFAVYRWYAVTNDLGPVEAVRQLIQLMQTSAYGPLIYIALYALRPLLFFSSILLTLAGGFIFGPVWGVLYTVIAANTSAMVAYVVGYYFGQGLLSDDGSDGVIQRYAARMRKDSFETVLIMRFIFLPYDLVNYLAGFLRIDWKAFLLATALGSIPGTISFILFGAAIEGDFDGSIPSLNPRVLAVSVGLFVVSLALSRYFKRREQIV